MEGIENIASEGPAQGKISKEELRLLKQEIGLLSQVTDYLDKKGLNYEIRNPSNERDIPKGHKGIEIFVKNYGTPNDHQVFITLTKAAMADYKGVDHCVFCEQEFPAFSKYVDKSSLNGRMSLPLTKPVTFIIEDPNKSMIYLNFSPEKNYKPRSA